MNPPSDMVVEHAYLRVVDGREAEFEAIFRQSRPILESAPGCRDAALFRDAEHPGEYLLRVTWSELRDHLEVFPASQAGRDFVARVGPFFAEAPQVRHVSAEAVKD